MTMEKNCEQLAAIKFCYKVVFTAAKMWEMFVKAFGDSSVLRRVRSRLKMQSGVEGQEQRKQTKTSLGWQLFRRTTVVLLVG